MFLMPGLVIACYLTGILNLVLTHNHKAEMKRYLTNHQNEDGGFGLHIEGPSTMFGTALKCAYSPAPPSNLGSPSALMQCCMRCLVRDWMTIVQKPM